MTTQWPEPFSESARGRWPWSVADERGLPSPVARASATAPPDWVREAIHKHFGRLRDWMVQSWTLLVAPRRFMDEWATGRRDAMDPLAFFAAGAALKALVARCAERVVHVDLNVPATTVTAWVRSSTGTTLVMFILGAVAHLVLRRRSHAPFRSTVAAVAYVLGGPGALFACAGWGLAIALQLSGRDPSVSLYQARLPAPVLVCAYLPHVWTVFALAGVHRASWVRIGLAVLAAVAMPFALIGTSLLLKSLAPHL